VIESLLLTNSTFDLAVHELSVRNVTSPGYVIVGGTKDNEGVVIARDFNKLNHTEWLGDADDNWFKV
jgi:hypothetical protein